MITTITQDELTSLADAWISYWHAPESCLDRKEYSWATALSDLEYHEPETRSPLILEIHRRDRLVAIQQVLSAGPIENLLAIHGASFIERVKSKRVRFDLCQSARRCFENPHEGCDLGSAVAVWDRRGWTGYLSRCLESGISSNAGRIPEVGKPGTYRELRSFRNSILRFAKQGFYLFWGATRRVMPVTTLQLVRESRPNLSCGLLGDRDNGRKLEALNILVSVIEGALPFGIRAYIRASLDSLPADSPPAVGENCLKLQWLWQFTDNVRSSGVSTSAAGTSIPFVVDL